MRTTIDIDEKLMQDIQEATGQPTKSEAVSEALERYLRYQRLNQLRELQGELDLDLDDWYEFRHSETK